MQQEDIFYEDRFLKSWAGSIITNPSTAIVELVANCWDAYATEVKISWPDPKKNKRWNGWTLLTGPAVAYLALGRSPMEAPLPLMRPASTLGFGYRSNFFARIA